MRIITKLAQDKIKYEVNDEVAVYDSQTKQVELFNTPDELGRRSCFLIEKMSDHLKYSFIIHMHNLGIKTLLAWILVLRYNIQ